MIRLIDSRFYFFSKMYFLEKMCRICVKIGAPLVDINTVDFDSVKLSEKLEVCAKMVADSGGVLLHEDAVSEDNISSDICEKCVNKLRVSYHFLGMCEKSTKIIQGYLEKLTSSENAGRHHIIFSNFEKSELNAVVEKLPDAKLNKLEKNFDSEKHAEHNEDVRNETEEHGKTLNLFNNTDYRTRPCRKKQRITKEQRCSLLQRLLNRPKKERDKPVPTYHDSSFDYEKGGLKSIIDFAKNYEFSFKLDKNSNIESTPLDKLTAFSTNYFRRDFTEFKNHILFVIENRDGFECGSTYSTDDEDCLSESQMDEEEFEEVTVEPDIKIKSEIMDCDEEESQCPLDYLETSFEEEDIKIKKETEHAESDSENDLSHHNLNPHSVDHLTKFYLTSTRVKEENCQSKSVITNSIDLFDTIPLKYKSCLSINSSPAVKLLDKLVSTYPMGSRKIFSPSNVRCRTRDQPYINPQLKDQFLYRSFRCERCNRYFKSQGYLKAHTSKVH